MSELKLYGVMVLVAAAAVAALAASRAQDPPPAPSAAVWGSDCRFEIVPLESRFFPAQHPPDLRTPASRTILLDQCSGATWVLTPHGGPSSAVWQTLPRELR